MTRWRAKYALAVAAATLIGTLGIASGSASASGSHLHVSTSGSDVGNCLTHPCATIDYAISQAPSGGTIRVAPGTYHQTVQITKPIHLLGTSASNTILNGAGLDPGGSFYGVIYVGTTGGSVSIKNFTITNPFPYAYTSGEPEVVALIDQNPSDSVSITRNIISEGSSDANASTDFPIGIDTFKNAASTTIAHDTITGTFQGALLEDNGPATFAHNTIENLIPNTSAPTTYPGEGLFFLSDLSGAITRQNATNNTFTGYAGYGVIMEAGYSNGNCSTTPCNGSISGSIERNSLALGGAAGAAGIVLQAQFAGNTLHATVTANRGYVTSPSQAIMSQASSGATITGSTSGNHIRVHSS